MKKKTLKTFDTHTQPCTQVALGDSNNISFTKRWIKTKSVVFLILMSRSSLLLTNLKMLRSTNTSMHTCLTLLTFQSHSHLLCRFCLLVENRFCLTTISRLLIIITTFSLCAQVSFSSFILRDFAILMILAPWTKRFCNFWEKDHVYRVWYLNYFFLPVILYYSNLCGYVNVVDGR